jgi:hypothetical protein
MRHSAQALVFTKRWSSYKRKVDRKLKKKRNVHIVTKPMLAWKSNNICISVCVCVCVYVHACAWVWVTGRGRGLRACSLTYIQYAKVMRHILCLLYVSTSFFDIINGKIFGKKVTEHKTRVLVFSILLL